MDAPIPDDRMLGDPGAYVHSGKQAWPAWQKLGHKGVLATMTQGEEQLDGFADAAPATRALARHMLAQMGDENGIHAFVTHDFLITILASRLIGDALAKVDWPWFLEAVFLWREGAHIHVAYRERHAMSLHAEFIPLDDRDVVDFAKRQLAQVVGLDYPGRLFLAGGAFKSLLTGKPAKDLDVWAPSANDRELLIGHLLERGAERLPPTDLGDQFCIAGIEVDVPRRIEPDSLEDRLARFDLTLSAIGVEHSGLVHALLGVHTFDDLLAQPWVGASYEGFVIEQILGALQGVDRLDYAGYFRTSDGHECDLVVHTRGQVWAVEVKLSTSVNPHDLSKLRQVGQMVGATGLVLVSRDPQKVRVGQEVVTDLAGAIEVLVG